MRPETRTWPYLTGRSRQKGGQLSKGNRKRFVKTKSTKPISSLTPLRPSGGISSSSKWYRDCRVELDRFQDVLFDGDYSRLIIQGEVPEETLKEAWNAIYLQYTELTQDGVYNELLDKTHKIQELNARITFLDGAVLQLQMSYDPLIMRILNEMAIPLALEPDENPMKKLKAVQARGKRMILEMEKLQKEVAELQQEKRESIGWEHFEEWLSIMSKSFGYAVKAKDISVIQFVKNQKKLNEQAQKQQDGTRKN